MFVFSCGGSVSIWQNKNPTAGLAVGFDKSGERIRTQPPRGTTAARLAAGSDSSLNSRSRGYVGFAFASILFLHQNKFTRGRSLIIYSHL
jgi:hypothetical protein